MIRVTFSSVVCLLLAVSPMLASTGVQLEPQYGEPNGTFPTWEERAVAQLTNRARVEPATDLAGCPAGNCPEAACYSAAAPLFWHYDLNQAARFHSLSMAKFPFADHTTPCALFSDIDARFPGSSDGSFASSCSGSGTTSPSSRVNLFGGAPYRGENIAGGYSTPHSVFYDGWLWEASGTASCGNSGANGHRFSILSNVGPALGVGYAAVGGSPYSVYWTQDFGGSGIIPKIPSGSHWTAINHFRDPNTGDNNVEFWANWYDQTGGGPLSATVVLDNVPVTMVRSRGTEINGAYSATVAGVTAGCHTYYFSFVDASSNVVRYPTTGSLGFGAGCADFQNGTAPPAPTGVTATATFTSGTQVHVTWNASPGATSYQIFRRDPGGSFTQRGTSVSPEFTDNASANTSYLYRVRALNASGTSPDSAADIATTVQFTDDPLTTDVIVKAVHLAELRTAVNAVRVLAGIGAAGFTDDAVPGVEVRAAHITEVRARLDEAMSILGFAIGGWTNTSLTGVEIKATHFQEIRNRVK